MTPGYKKASTLTKTFAALSAATAMMGLGGCASMPGTASPLTGDDQQNTQICMNFEEAQAAAHNLAVGTPKAKVYETFHIQGDQALKRMNKEDINRALYGQATLNIPFEKRDEAQNFLNNLEGRSLVCQNVHSSKKFGLTHSQTDRNGYQYTLTFIFKDAVLFDPVSISGEPVRQKTNRGYLSDFSPLDAVTRAARGGF